MRLCCVGLNHKTAPIEVRERAAVPQDAAKAELAQMLAQPPVREAVLLSTCNRVEWMVATHAPEEAASALHAWFAEKAGKPVAQILPHLYTQHDEEAVVHLFEVASGLDSLVLGEPQILGQVKAAYEAACQAQSVGHVLHRLYQTAFAAAKRARSETDIGKHPVSVASCAVDLAKRMFGTLAGKIVLLVGAGEMAELAATHLQAAGVAEIWIANRTLARAEALARRFQGHALALAELERYLDGADIVIASTGAAHYVITPEIVQKAQARREAGRPLFIIDIAAPRDVDPRVAELDDVYVFDIDDLEQVVSSNRRAREAAAEQARTLLHEEARHFVRWLKSLEAVPIIRALQMRMQQALDAELARAKYLRGLDEEAQAAARRFGEAAMKKLLHPVFVSLKHLPEDMEGDLLLGAAAKLFGMEEQTDAKHTDSRAHKG